MIMFQVNFFILISLIIQLYLILNFVFLLFIVDFTVNVPGIMVDGSFTRFIQSR